jgi:hypothetical protein
MAKGSKPQTTREVHRSSESGKFVTEKYADKHPKTTETEKVKIPPPSKKKS